MKEPKDHEQRLSKDATRELAKTYSPEKTNVPSFNSLEAQFLESGKLVDDIVLKRYLHNLSELEVLPLDESIKQLSDIRIFKINEMVYQNNEYSTYKFASVFSSVQHLDCGVFIIADSNGEKTDFYMGVRSFDNKRTTKSLKDTLKNALVGQFPGVKSKDLLDPQAQAFLEKIETKNIAVVSTLAENKDENFKNNETFIQGLEKLVLAMQGQTYTAIILAKNTPIEQLYELKYLYESIYTELSPFADMQVSYASNYALSVSEAFSRGASSGTTNAESSSLQTGTSYSKGKSTNHSTTQVDPKEATLKAAGQLAMTTVTALTAVSTGGLSLIAGGMAHTALEAFQPKTYTDTDTATENFSESRSETLGRTRSISETTTTNQTETKGLTTGSTETMQLTLKNKTISNILDIIDLQLQRIDECESIGMWESAAYFLSDSQETAEMAAGTYKALMRGERTGVEASAINFWGRHNSEHIPMLREYITNFIHPIFQYQSPSFSFPVSSASLVSSNELAIQMGLPRQSVSGFPVIEHASFGKEVVTYRNNKNARSFTIGNVYNMGGETPTPVKIDCDSLAMHTFITGSTGAGKSNTVYEILNQTRVFYEIPFMVIEPAKGEYKNIFGNDPDVTVYGSNPHKTALLRINPFSFPEDVHVLEHLDRLVEVFNVCWPMYAAMPAILKEAMEKAYVAAGWDMLLSSNSKGGRFPNFTDLLDQIDNVIKSSNYSADTKGDYSGALLTRVRSLTTGLNQAIFSDEEISSSDLFDKNVIADLSRIGSTETKSLIMGLLIMKLNEYRMSSGKMNSPLSHITVLEEAHHLLRRTSTEQSSETANLLGKSVEILANSIAEMRTYGEGFIIADQAPGLLDLSVIRNTNTKIIMRLPDQSDRELVGYAAGLNREQVEELSRLKVGVAAVYQNDWVEPVLVQINKCNKEEVPYVFSGQAVAADKNETMIQLINFLANVRYVDRPDFSIDKIGSHLKLLNLSSSNHFFVEEQLQEYRETGTLSLWDEKNFRRLSRKITDILRVRDEVEKIVVQANLEDDPTRLFADLVNDIIPMASDDMILVLSHCFMKDLSMQNDEIEARERAYKHWVYSVVNGGELF